MRAYPPAKPGPASRTLALRLLLVLMLASTPLTAGAQLGLADSPAAAPGGERSMPCHTADAVDRDAPPASQDCPHCADPALAAACDCCDQATPVATAILSVITYFGFTYVDSHRQHATGSPPVAPGEPLFRPPIRFA